MPTILMIASSPLDQDRLRLSAEFRDIRHALQRSRNRENWVIESNEAATVDDLRRALLDFRPQIVHFAGHGSGTGGLCFEDSDGNTALAGSAPLAKLFHHFKKDLQCVVLNACYSSHQGSVISKEIDYVVGMSDTVGDASATKFAVSFYDAVFAGTDFRTAFDLGCTALDLSKLPDSDVPVFITAPHLTPKVLSYSAYIPEIERVLYAYFNTPFNERGRLTTTGESIAPVLEQHYRGKMHHNVDSIQVTALKQISSDQWCVEINGSSGLMYVRIRDRQVLVEWEASVGLWSVPPKTFLALGSDRPVVARVFAELGTYYNYEFTDRKRDFQSVNLGGTGTHLNGYVARGTDTYDKLISIIGNGGEHAITLELVQSGEHTNMPYISKVLSETWIYNSQSET